MNRRKEIIDQYKARKLCGGVYLITNTLNGKYLINHTPDLKSARNRFQFSVTSGSAVDTRLQQDWKEMGAQAFTFTVLEEIEQGPEQSKDEFMDDLQVLEQLWRAKLDASKAYS